MSNKLNDNHRDDELLRYAILLSNPRVRKHVEKVTKLLWTRKLNDIGDTELLAAHTVICHFPLSFPYISEEKVKCDLERMDISGVKIIDGKVKVLLNVHFECVKWLDS